MALSENVRRRILQENGIDEGRLGFLSDADFEFLANRHGGLQRFGAPLVQKPVVLPPRQQNPIVNPAPPDGGRPLVNPLPRLSKTVGETDTGTTKGSGDPLPVGHQPPIEGQRDPAKDPNVGFDIPLPGTKDLRPMETPLPGLQDPNLQQRPTQPGRGGQGGGRPINTGGNGQVFTDPFTGGPDSVDGADVGDFFDNVHGDPRLFDTRPNAVRPGPSITVDMPEHIRRALEQEQRRRGGLVGQPFPEPEVRQDVRTLPVMVPTTPGPIFQPPSQPVQQPGTVNIPDLNRDGVVDLKDLMLFTQGQNMGERSTVPGAGGGREGFGSVGRDDVEGIIRALLPGVVGTAFDALGRLSGGNATGGQGGAGGSAAGGTGIAGGQFGGAGGQGTATVGNVGGGSVGNVSGGTSSVGNVTSGPSTSNASIGDILLNLPGTDRLQEGITQILDFLKTEQSNQGLGGEDLGFLRLLLDQRANQQDNAGGSAGGPVDTPPAFGNLLSNLFAGGVLQQIANPLTKPARETAPALPAGVVDTTRELGRGLDTAVEKPQVLNSLESLLLQRLGSPVEQDPRVASQLADLAKSQQGRRDQRIEDLKRLGIFKDDGDRLDVLDELSEIENRERLAVLAGGENLRNQDIASALNLGNVQGGLNVQDVGFGLEGNRLGLSERLGLGSQALGQRGQDISGLLNVFGQNIDQRGQDIGADLSGARLGLDQLLGVGGLGIREKEADATVKRLDAAIEDARAQRAQQNFANTIDLLSLLSGDRSLIDRGGDLLKALFGKKKKDS